MSVTVSGGFVLLLAWLNYLDEQAIVPLALAACACHELGHFFAIRLLGGEVKALRLSAVGAELELSGPLSDGRECAAALAGPAVNLALALLFCWREGGELFAGLNLALACLNLLPASPLDGGRALGRLLAILWGEDPAARAGEILDIMFTVSALVLGGLLAVFQGNFTLLITAGWLAWGVFRPVPSRKGRLSP